MFCIALGLFIWRNTVLRDDKANAIKKMKFHFEVQEPGWL